MLGVTRTTALIVYAGRLSGKSWHVVLACLRQTSMPAQCMLPHFIVETNVDRSGLTGHARKPHLSVENTKEISEKNQLVKEFFCLQRVSGCELYTFCSSLVLCILDTHLFSVSNF